MSSINCNEYSSISSLDQISSIPDECIEKMLSRSIIIPIKKVKTVQTAKPTTTTTLDTTAMTEETTTTMGDFAVNEDVENLLSSVGTADIPPVIPEPPPMGTVGIATVVGAISILINQAIDASKSWMKGKIVSTKNSIFGKNESKIKKEEPKKDSSECNCRALGIRLSQVESEISSVQDDLNAIDVSVGDLKEGYEFTKAKFFSAPKSPETDIPSRLLKLEGIHLYTRQKLNKLIRKLKKKV